MFREYLIFHAAVARFHGRLQDLERERQRILEEQRPKGAQPIRQFTVSLVDSPREDAESDLAAKG